MATNDIRKICDITGIAQGRTTVYHPGINHFTKTDGFTSTINSGIYHNRMLGTIYWDDLRVSVEQQRVNPATSKPDYGVFYGGTMALLYDKDDTETSNFSIQMPHNWKEGSYVSPHVHFSPTTTGGGNIVWGFTQTYSAINGTFSVPVTGYTTGTIIPQTKYKHYLLDLPEITMTGCTVSTMMLCGLSRVGGDTGDTYGADVALLEFDLHYQIDSLGSRQEDTK